MKITTKQREVHEHKLTYYSNKQPSHNFFIKTFKLSK